VYIHFQVERQPLLTLSDMSVHWGGLSGSLSGPQLVKPMIAVDWLSPLDDFRLGDYASALAFRE